MNKSERRKIEFLTILAVVILFILLFVMVTLLVQKVQYDAIYEKLQEKIDELNKLGTDLNSEILYRQTIEWVEKYARELGMISGDETLFRPNN